MTDTPTPGADQAAAKAWAEVVLQQERLHESLRDADAINLARAYLALQQENDRLIHGLNVLVNCQSALPRAAMREATAELLNGKTIGMADQSPALARKETP